MNYIQANSGNDIAFVVPCLRSGGAEKVMVLLANAIFEYGNTVTFLFTADDVNKYNITADINIVINNKDRSPHGQINFIRNEIKNRPNTTFISFFTYQNIYLLIANIGLNRKVVVSERNDPRITIRNKRSIKLLRAILYRYVYCIVFQTYDAQKYFSKKIQNKSCIIYNPLTPGLDIYDGVREKKIVAVARFNKYKNLSMMFAGISKVLKDNSDYLFELYGEGDPRDLNMKSEIEDMITSFGLEGRVKLMGFRKDVLKCIKSASVYVSSSDYEGVSNAMLEALALAIPCVCTDCPVGGARMFIKNGVNGYLVPVGDINSFSEAIERVIAAPEIYKSSRIEASLLRASLSIEKIAQKWLEIL